MEPVNVNDPTLWDMLFKIFGAGGIPLLLGCAGLAWVVKYLLERQKEKDDEHNKAMEAKDAKCLKEMEAAEERWETRFQQMRSDIKEGFGIVAKQAEQLTILTTKIGATRMP